MIKEFNRLGEIQKYYDKESNTYVFKEDGKYITLIVFNFDLNVEANIRARDINALNINVWNVDAWDIKTWDIKARDINVWGIDADNINVCNIKADYINSNNINADFINYYAVCFAYKNIKCKSIKGRRHNAKHFVLDGKLEVLENE